VCVYPNWVTRAAACLSALLLAAPLEGVVSARPWQTREPSVDPAPAHQLRTTSTWPAEPSLPSPIDPTRFQAALAYMCNVAEDSRVAALAPQLLSAAAATGTDPFTLAALASFRSKCDPAYHGKGGSYGFLGIEPGMYRPVEGAPPLPVDRDDLSIKNLLDPATNIAVGAALLKMWDDKHRELDQSFGGVQHRSGVSHFVWGDEARSSGQEDLILTGRRRMLGRYLGTTIAPRPSKYGIEIVPPLDGIPRVATSGPGDDREGGARRHAGLDITAQIGEPVRSIAGGTVIFAGVNMPHRPRIGAIPPDKIGRYRNRRLGVGGIYVCIEHKAEPKKIVSCYMHLNSYTVNERQELAAGDVIGYVGRTGVKLSPAHLHFEVRVGDAHTNPLRTLGDYVIPPKATLTHQFVMRAMRAKRAKARLRA
jgi:hypothetical protein